MHAVQINFLPPPEELSPAEVFLRWPSLADIPEAAAAAGTRVSVIQAAACEARLVRQGIDYHFVDVRGADEAERAARFAARLQAIGTDVLHAHSLGFARQVHALAQRLPRLPILLQDHADRPPHWWQRSHWRRWYAAVAGVAFTATELARPYTNTGLLAPSTPVFAIPESSSRFTRGSRSLARAETGLYGDPCVLWVGHLNPGKDPLTVLDGVARAVQRLPGLRLWCAFGSGALLPVVQARIMRDPRLLGRVHLLGRVPHARIETLMRAADLFVSGSRAESCGFALLEALACGVTPVVTDIPSFRALTAQGRIGHLWPCGDAERLARALVGAALDRPSPEQVRAHFDAALSFAALGRQWAQAYAQVSRYRSAA